MIRFISFLIGVGILVLCNYAAFVWKSEVLLMVFVVAYGIKGYFEGLFRR